ncbi:MAG: hypothetical protein HUU01_08300 [Saprospiraceae bacterium]|nr:hypothetical protein [Saprospiraceae bacterium]
MNDQRSTSNIPNLTNNEELGFGSASTPLSRKLSQQLNEQQTTSFRLRSTNNEQRTTNNEQQTTNNDKHPQLQKPCAPPCF